VKNKIDPTSRLRWVKRSWRNSQRETLVLQQFYWDGIRGEWCDVPVVDENYPLPDGATNRGHLREDLKANEPASIKNG
jgi:hypothetical protein